MATPIFQFLSRTGYDTDGTTTVWDFSFAGGYLDKSHVKAYITSPIGLRTEIVVTEPMLIGEFQLQITPALAAGDELTIYRDTPKNLPLVDFTDEAGFSEVALDTNAKQAVFIAAEAIDTVNATDVSAAIGAAEIAGDAADAAIMARDVALAAAASAAADATAAAQAQIAPFVALAEGHANDAAASAVASSGFADDSAAYAAAASASAVAADASADAAAASAVAADASADAAAVSEANAAAVLAGAVPQTSSTGSAKLPAGTTAQRDVAPQFGWTRANDDTNLLEFYNGTSWVPVGAGATGGVNNPVFYENDIHVTANYSITSGKNAMSAGPIIVDNGVDVTVPNGSAWTIVGD